MVKGYRTTVMLIEGKKEIKQLPAGKNRRKEKKKSADRRKDEEGGGGNRIPFF